MRRFTAFGTIALLTVAAGTTVAGSVAAQTMSPADFVAAAGASDLYERQSSQLVLQSTRDTKVREFANMMVADHGKSTANLTAAAQKAGVQPSPPRLNSEQEAMIEQLRAARGPARDAAYVAQQKAAHQQALTLHRNYAANGTSAPLKAAAQGVVPVVQHHIEMLKGM